MKLFCNLLILGLITGVCHASVDSNSQEASAHGAQKTIDQAAQKTINFLGDFINDFKTVKCGEIQTFDLPQGKLQVRSIYTEERVIFNGYRIFADLKTAAWAFDINGKRMTGVLDFYGFDQNHPLKISIVGNFLEIKHTHGTHNIPLTEFFDGSVVTFGHEAQRYYRDTNACQDEMY